MGVRSKLVEAAGNVPLAGSCPIDSRGQVIRSLAALLRTHFHADVCAIVLLNSSAAATCAIYDRQGASEAPSGTLVDSQLAKLAMNQTGGAVVFHCTTNRPGHDSALSEVAQLLFVASFMSEPLYAAGQLIGRIYVGSNRRTYGKDHLSRLAPMAQHVAAVAEYCYQVRGLLDEVLVGERRRVSRDLHDSTIQPYIGLKLGLEALRRKLKTNCCDIRRDVDELVRMAQDTITDLRHYVECLADEKKRRQQTQALLPALQGLARRFSECHGIETHVSSAADFLVSPQLCDEVMHIAREGLSNIRRHTTAKQAAIRVVASGGQLILEFVNHDPGATAAARTFFPRSLGERARELGGRLSVRRAQSYTTVVVEVPLSPR